MGYWKRRYTERPSTRPLFKPEPKSRREPASTPTEPEASDDCSPEQPETATDPDSTGAPT